jgi:hypothetical protein
MASMMLAGNVCSRIAPTLVCVFGTSTFVPAVRLIPSPGRNTLTATKPTTSASVVTISKYTSAFSPIRPIALMLPALAMPATSVPNSRGAMIDLISRRKMLLTGDN